MSSNGKRVRRPTPYRNGKNCAPVESDADAPYSYAQLLRMNQRFVQRVEAAIADGLERPPEGIGAGGLS